MNNNVTTSFFWFIGVVEDINDPLQIGRLKVRIYNTHNPDKGLVPTSSLPWASVIVPITAGALNGIGLAPVGVKVNTTVVGFFADGSSKQVPIVLGCLPGITDGVNDITVEARGTNNVQRSSIGPEPVSSYRATYPNNRALRTSSGHVIEVDDTPGGERIHVFHKSGTYIEISPDGTKVDKTNGKSYKITNGDDVVYVNGSASIKVAGSVSIDSDSIDINASGSININCGGSFSVNSGGKITLNDGSPDTDKF